MQHTASAPRACTALRHEPDPAVRAEQISRHAADVAHLQRLLAEKARLKRAVDRVAHLEACQASALEELRRQAREPAAYATAQRTAAAAVEQTRRTVERQCNRELMPLLELWQRDCDRPERAPGQPPRVFANRGAQYG